MPEFPMPLSWSALETKNDAILSVFTASLASSCLSQIRYVNMMILLLLIARVRLT